MADWTEAKRDRLRRLWSDPTRTVREMGESLGKTPLAVSLEAQRLGLPSRYPNRGQQKPPVVDGSANKLRTGQNFRAWFFAQRPRR